MIAGSVFERDGGMADKGIGVGGYGIAGEPEDSEIGGDGVENGRGDGRQWERLDGAATKWNGQGRMMAGKLVLV